MVSINFEILKIKKTLTLEILPELTFSEISNLILKALDLDPECFRDQHKIHLKYIFNKQVCNESKTVESLNIQSGSKISVFIPKIVLEQITNKTMKEQSTINSQKSAEKDNLSSTEKENLSSTEKENLSSTEKENLSSTEKEINKPPENSEQLINLVNFQLNSNLLTNQISIEQDTNQPTNNFNTNPFLLNQSDLSNQPNQSDSVTSFLQQPILIGSPDLYYNESNYHSLIFSSIQPMLLQKLTDLNFDPLDSAYALCYKSSPEFAIELILSGVASNPKFRFHINKIISGEYSNGDDRLQHEIELAKFDAKVKSENEMVAIAAAINRHMSNSPIIDNLYEQKLIDYLSNVERLYPGKIAEKEREDFEMMNSIQNQNEIDNELSNVNNEFLNVLNGYPNMSPENFVNPYVLLYDDFLSLKLTDELKSIIDYGITLNYEQIGFLYKMMKANKVELNEVIQLLKLNDGDIVSTEQFIELNHN